MSACFLAALVLAQAGGEFPFRAPLAITNVLRPVTVAVGDWDGDRKLDLAAVNGGDTLTILHQSPLDRSQWTQTTMNGIGSSLFFVHAADFDADGFDEIVVADPATTAYFLKNTGGTGFQAPATIPGTRAARWVTSADLNGDGSLDLASADFDADNVMILAGDGKGGLSFLHSYFVDEPHAVEPTDFNADGLMDLIVGYGDMGLRPFKNVGGGNFQEQRLLSNEFCGRFISTGDIDGDGKGDIAASCLQGTVDGGIIARAIGVISNGDSTFRLVLDLETVDIGSTAIADMNGDGRNDVLVADTQASSLRIAVNQGGGAFGAEEIFGPAGFAASFVTARDLDGDGRADAVTADAGSNTLTVFWGREGKPFLESAKVIAGYEGMNAGTIGDVDRDGQPDMFFPRLKEAKVDVYLSPATSSGSKPDYTFDAGDFYTSILAADMDGDETLDLVGASLASGMGLVTFLDASGKRREPTLLLPAGDHPTGATAGDIDGDGKIDFAVPCLASGFVSVILGAGKAQFAAAKNIPSSERPKTVALGDVDGDGITDMVVAGGGKVVMNRGKGGGDFDAPVIVLEGASPAKNYLSPVLMDLSGDGLPDLLVGEARTKSLILLDAVRGGTFENRREFALGAAPLSVGVADVNGDALLDLTSLNGTLRGSILFNLGKSGFSTPIDFPAGVSQTAGHFVRDFDADGRADLAVLAARSSLIFFGKDTAPPAKPMFRRGDTDGDGEVKITDAIFLLAGLFQGGHIACEDAADADDTGALDITDAVVALSYLFQGGPAPPAPGPDECGEDPTEDGLAVCEIDCRRL